MSLFVIQLMFSLMSFKSLTVNSTTDSGYNITKHNLHTRVSSAIPELVPFEFLLGCFKHSQHVSILNQRNLNTNVSVKAREAHIIVGIHL